YTKLRDEIQMLICIASSFITLYFLMCRIEKIIFRTDSDSGILHIISHKVNSNRVLLSTFLFTERVGELRICILDADNHGYRHNYRFKMVVCHFQIGLFHKQSKGDPLLCLLHKC
ncbi:MAG: hypothetical protein KBE86_13395, partial [Chitinophagales bacterium]|nr:hypothetical protein [Chitinophagales bacterium]